MTATGQAAENTDTFFPDLREPGGPPDAAPAANVIPLGKEFRLRLVPECPPPAAAGGTVAPFTPPRPGRGRARGESAAPGDGGAVTTEERLLRLGQALAAVRQQLTDAAALQALAETAADPRQAHALTLSASRIAAACARLCRQIHPDHGGLPPDAPA